MDATQGKPEVPAKRVRGRPRKDGKPPGSVPKPPPKTHRVCKKPGAKSSQKYQVPDTTLSSSLSSTPLLPTFVPDKPAGGEKPLPSPVPVFAQDTIKPERSSSPPKEEEPIKQAILSSDTEDLKPQPILSPIEELEEHRRNTAGYWHDSSLRTFFWKAEAQEGQKLGCESEEEVGAETERLDESRYGVEEEDKHEFEKAMEVEYKSLDYRNSSSSRWKGWVGDEYVEDVFDSSVHFKEAMGD